jgi:cytochrome P450
VAHVEDLDLPVFGLEDTTLVGEHFHERVLALLGSGWLARSEAFGYVVLDRKAVDHVLRTRHARMPAIELLELQGVTEGPMHEQLSGNLLNLHGEAHRRLRALVQSAFTPQAADRLRPVMRAHLEDLMGAVGREADGCEFVSSIAKPYPARMIAEVVGAPVRDAARLGEWAYWIQSTFDPTKVAGSTERIERAAVEFHEYVERLLLSPSAESDDALLGTLREALDAGELSQAECVSLVGSVLIGGVDTTQAQLSHAMRLFAEHPGQWDALARDPSLVPAAVDEVLRIEPIAPFTARLVTEEFTHRDVTFPRDTVLVACATTANRDPATYHDPNRFDITADRGGAKPLSFGAGPHYCLGAALARAELEEALAFLVERIDRPRLAGPVAYDTAPGVYGLHALHLSFSRPTVAR